MNKHFEHGDRQMAMNATKGSNCKQKVDGVGLVGFESGKYLSYICKVILLLQIRVDFRAIS